MLYGVFLVCPECVVYVWLCVCVLCVETVIYLWCVWNSVGVFVVYVLYVCGHYVCVAFVVYVHGSMYI